VQIKQIYISVSINKFDVLEFVNNNQKDVLPIEAAAIGENSNFLYFDSLPKKIKLSKVMHTNLCRRENKKGKSKRYSYQ
jgi:hypothetical protein